MFSSPGIRPLTEENAYSVMAKKPGAVSARKPFADRGVNGKSPVPMLNLKPTLQLTNEAPVENNPKDVAFADVYSYKDFKDDFEDICPKSERLSKENIISILHSYCSYNIGTPPPTDLPELQNMFGEIPPRHFDQDSEFDVDIFQTMEESFEDVPIPELDFDNFIV